MYSVHTLSKLCTEIFIIIQSLSYKTHLDCSYNGQQTNIDVKHKKYNNITRWRHRSTCNDNSKDKKEVTKH